MQIILVQVLTPGVWNLFVVFSGEGVRVHLQQIAALRTIPLFHVLIYCICPGEEGGTLIKHQSSYSYYNQNTEIIEHGMFH